MGIALKRSALSPNIRERLDHSCAIADSDGRIVAQAEHIPVHLGSFKIGIVNLLTWLTENDVKLEDGDMILTNDPYISGTHLNDLMLLAPVFWERKLRGYVVNKAHHVDVGGEKPGSINPEATRLEEEGGVIRPTRIVRLGQEDRDEISKAIALSKTPSTAMGDLHAQIAANLAGIGRVKELFWKFEAATADAWAESITYGRQLSLKELSHLAGKFEGEDFLEWKHELVPIRATLGVTAEGVKVDFEGTAPQLNGPLNAVFGVTFASVAFAIRCMFSGEVPTNDGFYSTIEVNAPKGTILNPVRPAPVSGGNLETSQRVADVIFRAFSTVFPDKVPGAGCGTMMNVLVGGNLPATGYWAYYETVGGGSGGRRDSDGVSGVHVNMTNTLNTPVEVAERVYPLFFTSYKIRPRSGGEGLHRGGDGIVRSFEVTSPSTLSILADRFILRPWGVNGGGDAEAGRVRVRTKTTAHELESKCTVELQSGDEVVIETPGGGGWGKVKTNSASKSTSS
jgi:N-methylhydantoinase B